MISVPGYSNLHIIHQSPETLVYSARRTRDGEKVVLKQLRPEIAAPTHVARYRKEFEFLQSLDSDLIIKVHDLIRASSRKSKRRRGLNEHSKVGLSILTNVSSPPRMRKYKHFQLVNFTCCSPWSKIQARWWPVISWWIRSETANGIRTTGISTYL